MRTLRAPLRRAAAVLLLVSSTLLASGARPPHARAATGLDATDQAAALDLERKIADTFWYGQVFEVDYRTPQRIPGDLTSVNHFGDSALWTGTYLAAESFRYAVAKSKIASGIETGFWSEQRDIAKARIDQMVRKYHLLINISKNWNYALKPSINPPSFGGGVFRGEPGYLMRACIPTDAPSWATWGVPRGKRVFGPLPWDDGKQYWCEDGTSRDAYAGTTFGLMTAFDLVSPDDPGMRAMIRHDILAMTKFTAKYAWTTPRPHGNISLPPEDLAEFSPVPIFGHDFENFISPLFTYVPMARLNMAQSARHVASTAAGAGRRATYDTLWAEEVATQLPILGASMEIDSIQPNDGYYKFNLHHLNAYNLIRLETFGPTRTLFKQAFSILDTTTRDDQNAHFEAITYLLTGEQARLELAIKHLREWRLWKSRLEAGRNPMNSRRCGVDLECVYEDRLDIDIAGQSITLFPGTEGNRAARPIAVADRADADFLWQRPPTRLDGAESNVHRAPGVDYLLPYWMLRYATEVAPPRFEPFPPWPGPAHR